MYEITGVTLARLYRPPQVRRRSGRLTNNGMLMRFVDKRKIDADGKKRKCAKDELEKKMRPSRRHSEKQMPDSVKTMLGGDSKMMMSADGSSAKKRIDSVDSAKTRIDSADIAKKRIDS